MPPIFLENGDIYHALKSTDPSYFGFGEAYFSFVGHNKIKGWKKHHRMTLNLTVPVGLVLFNFVDDDRNSVSFTIGSSNYCRLTVPPNIWFAFKGLAHGDNLVMNIADIPHDPNEASRLPLSSFPFE